MNTEAFEIKILVILALIVSIAYAQVILFPLLLAFFIYLLLDPITEWLVNIRVPRVLASSLITLLMLGIILSTITFLLTPAAKWIENAPENLRMVEQKFTGVKKSLGAITKVADKAQSLTEMGNKNSVKVMANTTSFGFSVFGMTTNVLILISTILILVFFFLNYFKVFIENLENILTKRAIIKESHLLYSLKTKVSDYLFCFSLISSALGIVVGLAFWYLGMPNPAFFGFMTAILTFIPYLGHFIGILVTLFIALITFDSLFSILIPPLLYFTLTALEGQFITPILLGRHLNLNPLMVFLNMLIWSGLWGISGLLISIPMLIMTKILLENIPAVSKFSQLLEK